MAEFERKNGKWVRNNSDGTQTEVVRGKDDHFYWTQSDGTRVKSRKRYKFTPMWKEESFWDKLGKGFVNATMSATNADAPAVTTASGWNRKEDGSWDQSKVNDPGVKQLRDNLGVLSSTAYTPKAFGSTLVTLTPQTVMGGVGQLPWWQTVIGKAAGSMATGMIADEVSKATTDKTIGGNIREGVLSITPKYYKPLLSVIPEGVWDLANPFYLVDPYKIQTFVKNSFQPFTFGYRLYHSIGQHPFQRWDMMKEGKALLDNNLISLEEALNIPKTIIRKGDFKTISLKNGNHKLLLPSNYRSKYDSGFSLRHELGHVTESENNILKFVNSPNFSPQYIYDKEFNYIGLPNNWSEQRADWIGTLGGNMTKEQSLGFENVNSGWAIRANQNPQLFK